MPVKSKVTAMILAGKSVIKPKDFDTHENYKIAVCHIKELAETGYVDVLYELIGTEAILCRITEKGIKQLRQLSPL